MLLHKAIHAMLQTACTTLQRGKTFLHESSCKTFAEHKSRPHPWIPFSTFFARRSQSQLHSCRVKFGLDVTTFNGRSSTCK
jgi:hypothetical protein